MIYLKVDLPISALERTMYDRSKSEFGLRRLCVGYSVTINRSYRVYAVLSPLSLGRIHLSMHTNFLNKSLTIA